MWRAGSVAAPGEAVPSRLTVDEPSLNHALRPSLLPLKNPLVVRLVLNKQLIVWLDRVVQLECEEVLRVRERLHDERDNRRAHCDQRIVFLPDGPSVRV